MFFSGGKLESGLYGCGMCEYLMVIEGCVWVSFGLVIEEVVVGDIVCYQVDVDYIIEVIGVVCVLLVV